MSHRYTPTRRVFSLLAALALLAIGCFVWDWFAPLWLAGLVAFGVATLWDWLALRAAELSVASHQFSHQPTVQNPVTLHIRLKARIPSARIRFTLHAVQSDLLYLERVESRLEIEGEEISARWRVTPKERGNLQWPGAIARFQSTLGLLNHWRQLPEFTFKVYPKLNTNLQTLLNPRMLLEQIGVKTQRFKRADQLFESLRPYQQGDNYRHIDWKASARSNTLVTRQFEMENHHNILVCLDSSRLMGTLSDGISKLDWAIEAALHLAYLADYLKDRIGLVVFSNGVDQWIKPQKAPVEAFLSGAYDVKSKIVEADLDQVCAQILTAQKKRSLVIFLSDFIDASSMQPVLPAFGHLNRKHCSLFIGIEDPAYKKHLSDGAENNTAMDLAARIVAQDSMNRRETVLQQLRQMGLKAISASPETLVQKAMDAYLEIKLQGAI